MDATAQCRVELPSRVDVHDTVLLEVGELLRGLVVEDEPVLRRLLEAALREVHVRDTARDHDLPALALAVDDAGRVAVAGRQLFSIDRGPHLRVELDAVAEHGGLHVADRRTLGLDHVTVEGGITAAADDAHETQPKNTLNRLHLNSP